MPTRLIPLRPGLTRPIPLARPVMLIGRHLECDAQVLHPRVSRRHCCVVQIGPRLVVRDLGSRCGVWINGHPVEEADLVGGDELAIGPVLFRLEGAEPRPPQKPQAIDLPADSEEDDDSELIPLDED